MLYSIYNNYIGQPRKLLAADVEVNIVKTETRRVYEFLFDENSVLAQIFANESSFELIDSSGNASTYSYLGATPDFERGRDAISGIRVRKEH